VPEVSSLLIAAQVVAGLLTFWTGVCRADRMDRTTHRSIRYSMAAFATCGLAIAAAPWMPRPYGHAFLVAYAIAAVSMQFATARLWSRGVPAPFRSSEVTQ
jgi:hypothetical protein